MFKQLLLQVNDRENNREKASKNENSALELNTNERCNGGRTSEEKERDSETGGVRKKQI